MLPARRPALAVAHHRPGYGMVAESYFQCAGFTPPLPDAVECLVRPLNRDAQAFRPSKELVAVFCFAQSGCSGDLEVLDMLK